MHRFQHAIVIGASSGIGLEVARQLARRGTQVALVARRSDDLAAACTAIDVEGSGKALAYAHDVRDTATTPALFQQIARDLGGVDLVVYVAGIMPAVGPDAYETAKDAAIVQVNLIGAMAWLNEAADRFTHLGGGTIVGISSVAGDRGRRANPSYAASKAGLTTYLEALRNRLGRHSVRVVTIKPGYVATAMLAGFKVPRFLPVTSPEIVARQIVAAAERGRREVYVPAIWRPIMWVVRAVPSPIFQRLNV
jgi:decaprenylphospho-beta-D-erythro-pentofuranosid-2-ulose 2-reductase